MRIPLLVVALVFATAPTLLSQVTIKPTVGYMILDHTLGPISTFESAEIRNSLGFGVALETATSIRSLGVRLGFSTTFNADLTKVFGPCDACAGPPNIGGASLLNFSGSALWRPGLGSRVQPYLLGGVGLKRLEVRHRLETQASMTHVDRSIRAAVHAGAGIGIPVGSTLLELEAVDYLSGFWGDKSNSDGSIGLPAAALNRTRHDVTLSAGLRIRL
jgi:hypothetical protein